MSGSLTSDLLSHRGPPGSTWIHLGPPGPSWAHFSLNAHRKETSQLNVHLPAEPAAFQKIKQATVLLIWWLSGDLSGQTRPGSASYKRIWFRRAAALIIREHVLQLGHFVPSFGLSTEPVSFGRVVSLPQLPDLRLLLLSITTRPSDQSQAHPGVLVWTQTEIKVWRSTVQNNTETGIPLGLTPSGSGSDFMCEKQVKGRAFLCVPGPSTKVPNRAIIALQGWSQTRAQGCQYQPPFSSSSFSFSFL